MTIEACYLKDLGRLILDEALRAKESVRRATGEERAFEFGRLTSYYAVLSLMAQQQIAFGLPPESLSLDGFDPDSLLS